MKENSMKVIKFFDKIDFINEKSLSIITMNHILVYLNYCRYSFSIIRI